MRREEGAGLQWDKPSLTLRAAFLLRLSREGRKQESTRSQQAHKGYDAQENVHGETRRGMNEGGSLRVCNCEV